MMMISMLCEMDMGTIWEMWARKQNDWDTEAFCIFSTHFPKKTVREGLEV